MDGDRDDKAPKPGDKAGENAGTAGPKPGSTAGGCVR
jgi:hypothetical protein